MDSLEAKGIFVPSEITGAALYKFRETWPTLYPASTTQREAQQRTRQFLLFLHDDGYIHKHEARALLVKRVGKFTLLPVSDSGKWSYTAKGSVDFLSETTLRVDGAGGPACTILPQANFFADLAA